MKLMVTIAALSQTITTTALGTVGITTVADGTGITVPGYGERRFSEPPSPAPSSPPLTTATVGTDTLHTITTQRRCFLRNPSGARALMERTSADHPSTQTWMVIMADIRLTSKFAVLDVTGGRRTIEALLKDGKPITVTIEGHIVEALNDDGVSREFQIKVTRAIARHP
jgi:hypothetical protein